jgi:hypothetical protein
MKTFYPLGVASLWFSSEMLLENCKYQCKKAYQFKHGVKDDQIIRQKLQISILLILEMVMHVIWNGASVDAQYLREYCRP